jgi:hypothetical protein
MPMWKTKEDCKDCGEFPLPVVTIRFEFETIKLRLDGLRR